MFFPIYNVFILLSFFAINCFASNHEVLRFTIGTSQQSQIATLAANSSFLLQADNVPPEISYVMFQAHAQRTAITLSKVDIVSLHSSVSGTNVGLINEPDDTSAVKMWVFNNNNKNTTILIIVGSYDGNDPVPGGCNMEFPVDISPFLHLSYDDIITKLEYQHANAGSPRKMRPPSCSKTISMLSYDIYVKFLKEGCFNEEDYFNGILEMSNITSISTGAKKAKTYTLHPGTRNSFYTYPNVGVVYNVIARYSMKGIVKEAAYVPIASYGCSLVSQDYGCYFTVSDISRPVFLLLAFYAGFQVFFGHMFFNGELFFFGFLAFGFVAYVLFAKYTFMSFTAKYVAAAAVGAFGGLFWVAVWNCCRRPAVSLLLVGFVLGFLISCTLMYSPLGRFDIFTSDQNYWLGLGCGTLFITAVMISFPKALSIVASSVVGSFVAIAAYEQDLRGSLPYIIINVVKRALHTGLSVADNEYPFEKNEIISSSVWVGFSILGILVQCCLRRNRTDFGPQNLCDSCCPKIHFTCNCRSRAPCCNRAAAYTDPSERQPLISDSNHQNIRYYMSMPPEAHNSLETGHTSRPYSSANANEDQCNVVGCPNPHDPHHVPIAPAFLAHNDPNVQRFLYTNMEPPPPYSDR